MKKTLLLISATILLSIGLYAQEWNFGNDSINFPNSDGVPANTTVTIQGLAINAGATTATSNMGQVQQQIKVFGAITYHRLFRFNAPGYPGAAATDATPLVNMPTKHYLSFEVPGKCTILVHGRTNTSTSARKFFVTDGTNYIGSLDMPATSDVTEATLEYTGPAATLYMFCNNNCNLYLLKVTSPFTSVKQIPSDIGVSFNGTRILNEKGLKLEVYNVLGKLITRSSSSVSTDNFPKGVYIVRISGSNGVLKFSK